MSVAIGSKLRVNRISYQTIVVRSSSIYFELWQFSDFHCRHFFNSR